MVPWFLSGDSYQRFGTSCSTGQGKKKRHWGAKTLKTSYDGLDRISSHFFVLSGPHSGPIGCVMFLHPAGTIGLDQDKYEIAIEMDKTTRASPSDHQVFLFFFIFLRPSCGRLVSDALKSENKNNKGNSLHFFG